MKHAFWLGVVLFLLIYSLSALAFVDVRLSGLTCHEDGSLRFVIDTSTSDVFNLNTLNIRARPLQSDQAFTVTGSFSQESITAKNPNQKRADFHSGKGFFNESGNYKVLISYEGCRYPPCAGEYLLPRCPGFRYDCSLTVAHLVLTQCTATPDTFRVVFKGLNQDQYETRDPLRDVDIYFESNARQLTAPYIAGKQLRDFGKDTYVLTFPRLAHETARFFALGVRGCPQRDVKECAFQEVRDTNLTLLPPVPVPAVAKTQENDTSAETEETGQKNQSGSAAPGSAETESPAEPSEPMHPLFVPLLILCAFVVIFVIVLLAVFYLKEE